MIKYIDCDDAYLFKQWLNAKAIFVNRIEDIKPAGKLLGNTQKYVYCATVPDTCILDMPNAVQWCKINKSTKLFKNNKDKCLFIASYTIEQATQFILEHSTLSITDANDLATRCHANLSAISNELYKYKYTNYSLEKCPYQLYHDNLLVCREFIRTGHMLTPAEPLPCIATLSTMCKNVLQVQNCSQNIEQITGLTSGTIWATQSLIGYRTNDELIHIIKLCYSCCEDIRNSYMSPTVALSYIELCAKELKDDRRL